MTDALLQLVSLRGGSFDGQLEQAPPPPGALRLGVKSENAEWSELYLYRSGETVNDPEQGALPVMIFVRRDDNV